MRNTISLFCCSFLMTTAFAAGQSEAATPQKVVAKAASQTIQNEAPTTGETIRQKRLAQEADEIINPAPMETMHRDAEMSVTSGAYPAMQNKAYVQASDSEADTDSNEAATASAAVKAKKMPKPVVVKKAKPEALVYYDALQDCTPGVYDFNNPLNSSRKAESKITNHIVGRQSAYCHVDITYSGQSGTLQCLFDSQTLKALSSKKAKAAYIKAYVKGDYDPSNLSLYDQSLANVCLMAHHDASS